MQNKTLSTSPTEQNPMNEKIISEDIDLKISNDKHTTDSERKLSEEDIPKMHANKPSTLISAVKLSLTGKESYDYISRSNHSLDTDLSQKSSTSKTEPITMASTSNSILNATPVKKQLSNTEPKSEIKLRPLKNIKKSNENLDESLNIPFKESNKIKQTSPLLKPIDEVSQHSISSVS